MAITTDYITTSLRNLYGETITTADVRAWCTMNGTTYQTVSKKLDGYKVGRGKWNLTVQEKLEHTYTQPAAMPAVEQNLIPSKDDNFVKFGNFTDIKKIVESRLFYPIFITDSGNAKTFSVEQVYNQLNETDPCKYYNRNG